jgi:hypothetical protein
MTIKGRPDLVMLSIESADGRGDPDSDLMCEDAFGRPTMQALYGFPECILQVRARLFHRRAFLLLYWLLSISVPKKSINDGFFRSLILGIYMTDSWR